jgi:hypothetical protein
MVRTFIPVHRSQLVPKEQLVYTGLNTYTSNDEVKSEELAYSTDTRVPTIGREKTRKGCDPYSVPAGEILDQSQTSASGVADKSISSTTWLAAKITVGATGRLSKTEIEIKNITAAIGPIIIEFRADNSGFPSTTILGQSSIPAAIPTGTYAYVASRYIEAPQVVNGTSYWIIAYVQDDGSDSYSLNSTTSATTTKSSNDSGVTWSSTNYSLHIKTYVSTDSPVLGYHRAYKTDGTKKSLMAHGTNLYTINDSTGAITSIKSGLNAGSSDYNFVTEQDVVYYVNNLDSPRKWDFATETLMAGSPPISYDIIAHKSKLFFFTSNTKVIFSNAAAPETFTSTDFLYVPSPKSPDPIVKPFILNDNLFILTAKTKWALYGSDLSNMTLRKSTGLQGCVAKRAVCLNQNYAFYPSDDGVYRFNGATDILISKDITADYAAIPNKNNMCAVIWNNRYYMFYTPIGGARNSQCLIYNIVLDKWESLDTGTYISMAKVWDGTGDDGRMIQASNTIGAIYYAELESNTFNNLGKKLSWEIRPRYEFFTSPAATHQLKRWRPRFLSQVGNHSVNCTYDADFAGSPTTVAGGKVNMGNSGIRVDGSHLVGDGSIVGGISIIKPKLNIPGYRNYTQLRYARTGVNNPVEFVGHTLEAAVKQIR